MPLPLYDAFDVRSATMVSSRRTLPRPSPTPPVVKGRGGVGASRMESSSNSGLIDKGRILRRSTARPAGVKEQGRSNRVKAYWLTSDLIKRESHTSHSLPSSDWPGVLD